MAKEERKTKKTVAEVIGKNKVLFEYIRSRNARRSRIGVIVAIGFNQVGWSICKRSSRILIDAEALTEMSEENPLVSTVTEKRVYKVTQGDKFDFEIAYKKAIKRASDNSDLANVPNSILEKYEEMMERSRRYFGKNMPELPPKAE